MRVAIRNSKGRKEESIEKNTDTKTKEEVYKA